MEIVEGLIASEDELPLLRFDMGISFNDVILLPLLEALPKQNYILKHRLVFLVVCLLLLDLPSATNQTLPLVLVFFHYTFDLAQTCGLA